MLDYDDLLLWWAGMISDPSLASTVAGRFDHVLVDEYQDTNRLQAEILAALKPDGRGVTVVGDDAQSIYAFRAAEVRNILDFPAGFDPTARVITLARNYRSTPGIIAAANAVMAGARDARAKRLWSERPDAGPPALVALADEAAQADHVCRAVLAAREAGAALTDQAVLFRAAHHSAALEMALARRDIPFVKFGGLKFLDAAHVKDTLAVLRFARNPRDAVSGFRTLLLLPGVGPAGAGAALEALAAPDPAGRLAAITAPGRAPAPWKDFVALFRALPWPPNSTRCGPGTSRILSAATRTRPPAAPTWPSSPPSPPVTRTASDSSPRSPSTRQPQPPTRPARRTATTTV